MTKPFIGYADVRLSEWAKWARDRGPDWPRMSIIGKFGMERDGASQSGRPPLSMPDPVAEIDRIICKMPQLLSGVVRAHYLEWARAEDKAKKLGISRRVFFSRLESAQWFVYGQIT